MSLKRISHDFLLGIERSLLSSVSENDSISKSEYIYL